MVLIEIYTVRARSSGWCTRLTRQKFIYRQLTEKHSLEDSDSNRLLLDVEDFLEELCCHWVTDMDTLPDERHVQVVTILLLVALTGSRLSALLRVTSHNLDLFAQPDRKTALTLQIRLRMTKSRPQQKSREQSISRTETGISRNSLRRTLPLVTISSQSNPLLFAMLDAFKSRSKVQCTSKILRPWFKDSTFLIRITQFLRSSIYF